MQYKRLKTISLSMILACLFVLPAGALAAPATVGADSPEAAVTLLVTPFYDMTANNNACNAVSGRLEACPVTTRLLKRLQNPDTGLGSGNLIGRTQNPPGNITVGLAGRRGNDALVNTTWQYGANAYTIIFVVVHQDDGWAVDDTFCADPQDNSATSIYNSPVAACQVINIGGGGTNGTPGMPSTGTTEQSAVVWLGLLAALLLMAGLGSRFVDRVNDPS